MAIPA